MSDEIKRLQDQLRRALEGEAWHGPAVLQLVKGLSAEDAAAHPIDDAHSIWELVLHLAATYRLVLRRMRGNAAPLSPAEDWPEVTEPTEHTWQATLGELRLLNEEMRTAVGNFAVDRLDQPLIAGVPYSAYLQFIGLTQHDLYHAGQIALLKRALGVQP